MSSAAWERWCGGPDARFNLCGEFVMPSSEPKPQQINKLPVSLDSEVCEARIRHDRANFGRGTLSRRKMATFRGNRHADLGDDYP
jgi:hypothetical protein